MADHNGYGQYWLESGNRNLWFPNWDANTNANTSSGNNTNANTIAYSRANTCSGSDWHVDYCDQCWW
jgi:hypothetical protein